LASALDGGALTGVLERHLEHAEQEAARIAVSALTMRGAVGFEASRT
jgi:hypothetical protein